MDLLDVDSEKGFSLIWTIQNFNFCFLRGDSDCCTSPTFMLDDNTGDKWCINLYPERYSSHDSIELVLLRSPSLHLTGSPRTITIEITICGKRGTLKKTLRDQVLVFDEDQDESRVLKLKLNREEFNVYLSHDSLILKCRIWDMKNPAFLTRQCYARTIIGVERITYTCTLESFEKFQSFAYNAKQFRVYSEVPSFNMTLFNSEEHDAENRIQISIEQTESKSVGYSTCKISLVDAGGNIAHSVRDEFEFDIHSCQAWTFPFIEVKKILSNQELYLSKGALRLRCEFVSSVFPLSVKYNEIERTEYEKGNNCQLEYRETTHMNSKESLRDNLQQIYTEGKFCDLRICIPTKEFRVHKTILCARSKVFGAMFERDMKENRKGVVEIEDLEDDTVSKMLLFLYTDTVGEDLKFQTASSLYFAADKYGIMGLKRKCSDFLKRNLTVTNVCGVLVLADMHQDEELKSDTQKFIFEHSGELMKSTEWEKFMKDNIYLASEIMHTLLKR